MGVVWGYPELMEGCVWGGGRGRATFIAISKDVKHAVYGQRHCPMLALQRLPPSVQNDA